MTVWITTAPARITSARSGLMPRTLRRSRGVRLASSSTRSSSAPRRMQKPWMPTSGSSSASITVAARLRTAPPTPASRVRVWPSQCAWPQLLAHVLAQRLELLRLDPVGGQEALRRHDGAQPPGLRVERAPAADAGELHRAAADVERDAVRQRGRVHRREIAEPRLLLAREHLDVQPGALARRARRRPRGWTPRGSPTSRAAGRGRSRSPGRSGRTCRSPPARAPSARPGAGRPAPGARRRAPARRSRPSASTTRRCG